MATFIDDDGREVKAVTAEQHALDNPGHIVRVYSYAKVTDSGHTILRQTCAYCEWWNEEGYK